MFSTRHLTSFLTLTALTCTSAALYSANTQALTKSETAQSTIPADAVSKGYWAAKDKYNSFVATRNMLNEIVGNVELNNLTRAVSTFSQLFNNHKAFKDSLSLLEKDRRDGFITYIKMEHPTDNIDEDFTEAQQAVETLRYKLLQQLTVQYNDLAKRALEQADNKAALEVLLNHDCPALEILFKQIPNAEQSEIYGKLKVLQEELTRKIVALTKAEKDAAEAKRIADEDAARRKAAEDFARENTVWKKLTRATSKYGIPVVLLLSVAAGLTYGETKHKFISKLLWGKQPEKVIQLSWWARNWGWFKRLFRLRA